MSRKIPIISGATLAVIHFLIVGIPFIQSRGGGEAIGYLVLFVDFPLAILGEITFPRLLLNSVPFNFFWFVVLGTIMYFFIGYGVGVLISRAASKTNAGA
jgi:hypothetical protein